MLILMPMFIFASTPVYAGVFGTIKEWAGGGIFVIVLSAVLAILAAVAKTKFDKVTKTLQEAGEFLAVLGVAIEDKKLTRDELAAIVKQGKDVLDPWRTTPDQFKVN
jgi:hypothetical protein